MAMAMDRSKYRNPDMPVGYVKKESDLVYKYGVEIDGIHYVMAPYIYEAHIEERDDFETLSDFILSDDEDCMLEATVLGEDGKMSISKIKTEKDDKNEDDDNKVTKQRKKSHDNSDTSVLDTSVSQMDIDDKKGDKKKKKKSTKEHKNGNKSDSSSSSSTHKHHKHQSPSIHRHRSSSCRRHRSSSSHRHRSPSSHRHHTPSSRRHHTPSTSDKHEKIVTYSPSPSPPPCDEYIDVKVKEEFVLMDIKEEALDEPQHLFGSYHCEVCNITMNSLLTFNTHVNGKRHRKNMKVKNVSEAVAQNIPATVISEDQTKYPRPPPGVIRKRVHTPAAIQHVLEGSIKIPCPGLEYVIEIRGLGDVQYYCEMCDCVCSSNSIPAHLTGFKHRLNTVKQFKPALYDSIHSEPKYTIEKKMKPILYALQKKNGMGRMAVEIEELASDSDAVSISASLPSTSRDYRSISSTSKGINKEPGMPFPEFYNATIPNMDASDFFCSICQSHMNSLGMWEAHIRGKRHLTNMKKLPGDLPSKTKTILVDKRAYILDRIKNECRRDEPIVGLKEVRETEIPEIRSHSYQCFLCGSCHTSIDIIEHLTSLKHRTKYLDHIDFAGREIISGMSDTTAESLVKDMCSQVERREGSGKPEVHVNKNAFHR